MAKKVVKKGKAKTPVTISKNAVKGISPLLAGLISEEEERESPNGKNEVPIQKFIEFLAPSVESVETPAGRKPARIAKPIEQDEEILNFAQKPDEKKNEDTKGYIIRESSKDYESFPARREEREANPGLAFKPQRVDFHEVGRTIRAPQREFFVQDNEMIRIASQGRNEEEKNYSFERVDLNEVGKEKRYKLMK